MNDYYLSENAIKLLEDNGYTFQKNKRYITIKTSVNSLKKILPVFLFVMLATPLIFFYSWIGAAVCSVFATIWLLSRKRFSNESRLNIYPQDEYIECIDNSGKDKYTFWYVRSLFLRSSLQSQLAPVTSSAKNGGTLSIGIELRSRQFLDLLSFGSDYRDNSEAMNELNRFFRKVFRSK